MGSLLKILIVEDEEQDAEIIKWILQKEKKKYHFKLVSDKPNFIEALDHYKPDIILSDNKLPEFNATEALAIVKQQNLQVPFILVTGTVSEEFAANIIKQGADDYLLKDKLARLPLAIDSALKKKQTELEKTKAEEKNKFHGTLLNTIGQAVIATDLKGKNIFWNTAAENIYGWKQEEAMGKNILKVIQPGQTLEEGIELMNQLSQGKSWSGEFTVQHKNGYTFPVYAIDTPIHDSNNKLTGIIGVSSDITERKKTEEDLKDLNNRLRELSEHLLNVREEERIQIARNIHDELGQQLTGLKMEVSWLLKKIEHKNEMILKKEQEIFDLIDNTIQSVRRISSNLRPSILDDLGLIATLEWHSEEVQKRSGIEICFKANIPEPDLPVPASTALFRIYQEALTNVQRHAMASKVEVDLRIKEDHIILEVKDNGKGMNLAEMESKKTLGLLGIKERTHILGGRVKLNTQEGKGTNLKIYIPLQINHSNVANTNSR